MTDDAVLFDLDRTLVDVQSFTDYAAALADVEAILETWPDVATPATDWDGPTRRCMGVLVALSGDRRWQQVSDAIEAHEHAVVSRSQAMPGLREALEATRGRERAVVTLLPDSVARMVLDHHQIPIEVVVGRQQDLTPKPAPDQPLHACRLLGVRATAAVMVGDSTWDERAALAAGARFVGVTNGRASEFSAGTRTISDLTRLAEVL